MLQTLSRPSRLPVGSAARFLVLALGFLVVSGLNVAPASPTAERVEPSVATRRFIDAFASGDEALAESLASPLYAAEWRRLGVSAAERSTLSGGGTAALRRTLRFEYFGGIRTAGGFEHYLYGVWPVEPAANGSRTYSIWRIDADPEGRVVWLALVYLLGEDADGFRLVSDQRSLVAAASQAGLDQFGLRPSLGIAAANGREGHYLLGLGRTDDDSAGTAPARVRTFTLDSSGEFRPGSWVYGLDFGVHPYPPPTTRSIVVAPEDWELLEAYLAVIR